MLLPVMGVVVSDSAVRALGYAAASLTTVSFFPQALKILRGGDTRGISLRMYGLFTAGIALWACYGVVTGDGPVIAANLITLVPAGFVLQRRWRQWRLDRGPGRGSPS